jgi:hypothetical protein
MRPRLPLQRPALPRVAFAHRKRPSGAGDLLPILIAIWLAGVVRVMVALFRRETVGSELMVVVLTVALLTVALLSVLLIGARRSS